MKRILKIECERAFTGNGFKLALLIGCLLMVWHYFDQVAPMGKGYLHLLETDPYNKLWQDNYPGELYDLWLGVHEFMNTQGRIFYLILPMLSALPFADSYFADAKDGFLRSVCTRTRRLHYFAAKYIAVFLSAFTVIAVPLLLDLLLGMLAFPLMPPLPPATTFTALRETDTLPWLYYNMPVVFVLVFTFFAGLFGGLLAALALAFSRILNYRFLVLLAPFIVYLFLSSLCSMLRVNYWNPMEIIRGGDCGGDGLPALIVESLLFFLVSCVGFIGKGAREDVF